MARRESELNNEWSDATTRTACWNACGAASLLRKLCAPASTACTTMSSTSKAVIAMTFGGLLMVINSRVASKPRPVPSSDPSAPRADETE